MLKTRYILIAVLATLISSFAIELPYTQVNYIHFFVSKKTTAGAAREQARIHKTYYEEEQKIFLPPPILLPIPVPVIPCPGQKPFFVYSRPSPSPRPVNTLRGPPVSLL